MEEALLGFAHEGAYEELVELLESKVVGVDACDAELTTALMLACIEGHVKCAAILIDYGSFIDNRRQTGSTALFLSAQCGRCESVSFLLQRGAMIDAQHSSGATSLYVAAQMGHADVVELLCKKGANVNLGIKDRSTPIFVASQNGYPVIVRILEKYRADINARREDGLSPLWIACQMNHIDVVTSLIALGANADRPRNSDGVTALFKASCNGNEEIVELLMKMYPNLGILKCGYSALHASAFFGNCNVVEMLLENGANPFTHDKNGRDTEELANYMGYPDSGLLVADFKKYSIFKK